MSIEIKISKKPVDYNTAINFLHSRAKNMATNSNISELIWILEHPSTYTGGTSYLKNDILDKSIEIIKCDRGGKITFHGPGQIVFYIVVNLNKRKKDIRWFVKILENTIINTLSEYDIKSYADRKNIGIWVKHKSKPMKVGAIGLKVKKWIAYHGFSLNLSVNINGFLKIKPCGLKSEQITNLKDLKKRKFQNLKKKLIRNFIENLSV